MAVSGPGWHLAKGVAEDVQGIVTSGFKRLPHGVALFLELPEGAGGAWIDALRAAAPITPASRTGDRDIREAGAIAFTGSGLARMGMAPAALATFLQPFREGMFQEDRLRRLGDRRKGAWLDTVLPGGPTWSGGDAPGLTEATVHAALMLYATDEAAADALEKRAEAALAAHGVAIVRRRALLLDVEGGGFSREHFGFADGLAQPYPYDPDGAVERRGEKADRPDPVNGAPLGEFLIGHRNGHQEKAPGPVVPGEAVSPGDDRARRAGLTPDEAARGFYDFGRNGSYLVIRELRQDVAAFWRNMAEVAEFVRDRDPSAGHVSAEWLAERVVGRTMDGRVLRPEGAGSEPPGAPPSNDFLFYKSDPHGYGCPLGSHIRRANPRDGLTPKPEMRQGLLNAANNHRILRRGRKYGPKLPDRTCDDGADRGLLFVCLNTDIARQFEFIQQTWLLNSDFHGIFEEVDPLVGPDGWMTIPEDPLRRRVQVRTFVQMAGGEYFFLPSLPALRYLSML